MKTKEYLGFPKNSVQYIKIFTNKFLNLNIAVGTVLSFFYTVNRCARYYMYLLQQMQHIAYHENLHQYTNSLGGIPTGLFPKSVLITTAAG